MATEYLRRVLHHGLPLKQEWSHLPHRHFILLRDAPKPDPIPYESLVFAASSTKPLAAVECVPGGVLRLDFCIRMAAQRTPCPMLNDRGVELLAELPLRSGGVVVAMRRLLNMEAYAL